MARTVASWQRALAEQNRKDLLRLVQKSDVDMRRALIKAMNDIDKAIADLPSNGIGAAVRRAQYIQQRSVIGDAIRTLWGDNISPTLMKRIEQSTDVLVDSNKTLLKFLTRAASGRATELANSLYTSELNTWKLLQTRLMNRIDLSPSVYRNQALMSGKIDDVVNSGILNGRSAAEIAKDVRQYINPRVMGGVRYSAMRLGRTELNNAAHGMAKSLYADSPYVEAVKWYLSGSHPRPDECNAFADDDSHGLGSGVFPPDDVPDKPHPQCFCFIAPITPTPKQFIDKLLAGDYNNRISNAA
jgi:hypothetical protein